MSWQIVIPWIGPVDLLVDCIDSMQLGQIRHRQILVVDNTPTSETDRIPGLAGLVDVERHPQNLGIAASWNRGLARDADHTLLLSAAMRFTDGLRGFVERARAQLHPLGMRTSHAWHAHVIGRRCVERVGVFDEGFWPCEYEDTDYMRRMRLASRPYEDLPDLGDAGLTCVGNSIAGRLGLVPKSDGPREYYLEKWGGDPGEERYGQPYDGRYVSAVVV